MNNKNETEIGIDVGRVLFGLSRIGYTTSSAICDIIDNSVRANAKNIYLDIIKARKNFTDSKRNNVKEYTIIDDGDGMDEEGILDALKLGSSNNNYEKNTLAKFGLGLKSATFSQADTLQILSATKNNEFIKYVISLQDVIKRKEYFALKMQLDDYDKETIKKYLKEGKGTIIRVSDVKNVNHPSVKKTIEDLKLKIGVIYYYFLNDKSLSINVAGKKIDALDPLFVNEANTNGNLNENTWEGTEVKWIEKTRELVLDDEENIKATIEITQLPYPPIFKIIKKKGEDRKIRKKYLIGANNYGFYVYRNKRLISWVSKLQGIIPTDQDYFSFRGRILIEDAADDYFNIDVKKSSMVLSDEAWNVISDFTQEGKRKSKQAWQNANKHRKGIINQQPNEISNTIINDFEQLETLPGDKIIDEDIAIERQENINKDMKENAIQMAKMTLEDEGGNISDINELTEEQKEKAIKGEVNERLSKIFRVSSVIDNLLWEPYYDTNYGNCVRINKFHRFARLILEENQENQDMQIIFDMLFLQLADAELYAYKNIDKYKYDELKFVLAEYRRIVSEFLANMCRKLEQELPPNYISNEYD